MHVAVQIRQSSEDMKKEWEREVMQKKEARAEEMKEEDRRAEVQSQRLKELEEERACAQECCSDILS